MPPESTLGQHRCLLPCPPTGMRSAWNWKNWRPGCWNAGSRLWRWIDGCLLDSSVPDIGKTEDSGAPCKRVSRQKRAGQEDCQWIQHLHSVGLLRGSFRPDDEICAIRSLWRHRDNLIQLATVHLQHMQEALDRMNLQIHHLISDLSGATGLAITDAILAGERDPQILAKLRDWRIKASEENDYEVAGRRLP